MRAGHQQGGGIGRCSSVVFREKKIVGSELSEYRQTHTLSDYPLGKPLEAKLLEENQFLSGEVRMELFKNYFL